MKCPICGGETKVADSVATKTRVYRKRVCNENPEHVHYTIEGYAQDQNRAEFELGRIRRINRQASAIAREEKKLGS